jgi:hypothetical protein
MAVDKEVKKPAPSNEANEEKDKDKKAKNKEPPKEAELVTQTNGILLFHYESDMSLLSHVNLNYFLLLLV